jgi:hypothetical protein
VVWPGHVSALDPRLALIKAWVFFVSKSRDPAVSGPDPTQRCPGLVPGARDPSQGPSLYLWRSWTLPGGPYMQGSDTFLWGSGPTVDTLEGIVFSGHVAAPEPSTWWGRVLFTTRLEIAARAPRLHTVVRGTPVLGYRQTTSLFFIFDIGNMLGHVTTTEIPPARNGLDITGLLVPHSPSMAAPLTPSPFA